MMVSFLLKLFVTLALTFLCASDSVSPSFPTATSTSSSSSFDIALAKTSVFLSASIYCNSSYFNVMDLKNASADMRVLSIVEDTPSDTVSFISGSLSQRRIYIVFKGSSSYYNFETDAEILLIDYPCPAKNCKVHMGFFKTYSTVKSRIFTELASILSKPEYVGFQVVVTGHSLGAALATLLAVDLSLLDNPAMIPILMNFGSPRVGETNWASYASAVIAARNRVTHHKDEVPHMPTTYSPFDYTHISGEWYEDENETFTACSGYEDPKCADQWSTFQVNVEDHMLYIGQDMWCPWSDYEGEKDTHSYFLSQTKTDSQTKIETKEGGER